MGCISPSLRFLIDGDKCATAWKPAAVREPPTFCQFSNCRVNPYLLKSSIASTADRAMVPTTQICPVVAQHRDCFSIRNNHFFASNNDWTLLNSLLLSCEETGKCWLQNCLKCAYKCEGLFAKFKDDVFLSKSDLTNDSLPSLARDKIFRADEIGSNACQRS